MGLTRGLFDDAPPRKTVYDLRREECARTRAIFGAYPVAPGWKGADTSEEAARTTPATLLRAQVQRVLARHPASADQVADALGLDVLAIRPRVSELRAMGRVVDSGQRTVNRSGKRAVVWRWVEEHHAEEI